MRKRNDTLFVYTDGGARGNPGPAAIGVYITNSRGIPLARLSRRIGYATNNVSEYSAVVEALTFLEHKQELLKQYSSIHVFLDSQLAYSQIVGTFRVKHPTLRVFLFTIRKKEANISLPIHYFHVPREKNTEADRLVNSAFSNREEQA